MRAGHKLQAFPWVWGGVYFDPEVLSSGRGSVLIEMAISKFWLDAFGEKSVIVGRGHEYPPITFDDS